MGKSALVSCLAGCSLIVLAACGDDSGDDDKGSGGRGGGGGAAAQAGEGGGGSTDDTEPNLNCPQTDVGPTSGPYVHKGACCYRTSNKARIDKTADERVLEFRTNYFSLINHLTTIDPAIIEPITIMRFDNDEQSILMRFVLPQVNGKVVAGKGRATLGPGRYNCDGKYSFYSDTAAPGDNPGRWAGPEIQAQVNPEKTDQDLIKPTFKDALAAKNRPTYLPYLGAAPDYALDWEGASQGFDIIQMPTGDANLDCVGSLRDSGKWGPVGKTIAYGRLDLNTKDKIAALGGVTFCQLMAFGTAGASLDCTATPRCEPGQGDCKWQRLPDSLCPVTEDEMGKWGCHLGYGDNPDNAPVTPNCSMDPITDIDPDKGTKEGRCCDPLAKGTNGLPACNAWLQINAFVAASVEITDNRADELQKNCHGN